MSEWEEYKLGSITKWKSGGTPSKQKESYWNGNVPWISAKTFKTSRIYDSEIKITEEGLDKGSRIAEINSILLLVRGSGLFNGIPIGIVKAPVAFNQDIKAIEADLEKILPEYLFYWLMANRPLLVSKLEHTGIGAGKFETEIIKDLTLLLPPLPTQKAIVEILSSLDDKIELNNQINQNLEALAQALFKQWFVDFEFPNENGEPYKSSGGEMADSELGEIPKGWELESLENFGEVICGKTPSKAEPENFGNEVPFIKIPDMHGKIFITETIESLSIKGANSQKKKLLPQGSVMISSIATVGLVALTTRNSQTNQQINSIIPKHAFQTYFLYFLCLELKPTFLNLASGGAVTLNMNTSTFKSLKVIHPKSDILESFHKRVETIFEQILNLQIESENLSNLRDTLLPKLISGVLEVNESLLEPTF